jgi:hypothetical protein
MKMHAKGILAGPEGDTLFSQPFVTLRPNEFPLLFQKVQGLNDHRLLALVTALVVEERLDKLLATFCPRYERLRKQDDFTFSLKIRVLEALSLIPVSITTACHIIRSIRNDFAHNLNLTCFSDLKKGTIARVEGLLQSVDPKLVNPIRSRDGLSTNYRHLSLLAIVGVDLYAVNVETLRKSIREPAFVSSLQDDTMQEFKRRMQESRARGAKQVAKQGNKWAIQYDCFSEIVDQLPTGIRQSSAVP